MANDVSGIGSAYRLEGEKSKHRTIAFAVILVLAHLLDVRPSEIDGLGLKITLKDPSILYGTISLVFGYYLSRFISDDEKGETLYPVAADGRRMRAYLRMARRNYRKEKKNKGKTQTPAALKRSARRYLRSNNIILFPYRLMATIFVLIAICFMLFDIYHLADTIWKSSQALSAFSNSLTGI